MTPETIEQIQKLIGLSVSLLLLISLIIIFVSWLLEQCSKKFTEKEILERDELIKKLKEQLKTKTEMERMRYEHQKMFEDYKKWKEETK